MQRTVKTVACLGTFSAAQVNYHGRHHHGINSNGTKEDAFGGNAFPEHQCCLHNRRLSDGKHHFRALGNTPSCGTVQCLEDPVRVFMDRKTSRIWAVKEIEDGTFQDADLGSIRPDFQSILGKGFLFFLGKGYCFSD